MTPEDGAAAKVKADADADAKARAEAAYAAAQERAQLLAQTIVVSNIKTMMMDYTLKSWLYSTVAPNLVEIVSTSTPTSRSIWIGLLEQFIGKRERRALILDADFWNFEQGDLSISEYCRKLKSMADALGDLGEPVLDRTIVLNVLRGRNEKFTHIASLITHKSSLPNFIELQATLRVEKSIMKTWHHPSTALISGSAPSSGQASQSSAPPPPQQPGGAGHPAWSGRPDDGSSPQVAASRATNGVMPRSQGPPSRFPKLLVLGPAGLTVVLIVGAGPAGLATAACLTKLSIPYVIVEREDCSASLWRNRAYDRLKLHLAKVFCELPHMSYPIDAPTYIPKDEFVKYLDKYIERFDIKPKYSTSIEQCSYDEGRKCWFGVAFDLATSTTVKCMARFLVVASGENSAENIPNVPGLDSFHGEVIHSSRYKSGTTYSGKNVLVVGCGNSGMEIAYDLANHGANTSIVVRSPVLRSLSRIKGDIVEFEGRSKSTFDAIVFATGYRSTANKWLKNDQGLLNDDGLPKKRYPNHWKGANGIYCAGLARRGLAGIAEDAKNIANDILSSIGSR
ncbi:hypothetical protein PR202_ga24520 [Eleusine coracana subsp. coracana]|uniref:indole-3-pyruvate monooxygenase n=1 Tax=Eleusine coracana subsp. coracana TaxID=191504 RepID=A0AAV5D705_ELECO|nr:hypothetical protein PR202_ga24520 [Eleusine coracana subsp. coracana]